MVASWSRRIVVLAIAACAAAVLGREPERCAVCGRALPSTYWVYDDQPCCSQACADRLKPTCLVCGKTISAGYVSSSNKVYCSESCFESTLPKCDLCAGPIKKGYTVTRHKYCETCYKKYPTCFSCGLPAAHATRLEDGRDICALCMRWAVKKSDTAQSHFDRSLRHIEAWTSLKIETVPTLALVDRTKMQELSKNIRKSDSPVSVRGLYSRQITTTQHRGFGIAKQTETDIQEHIYIVDYLHDAVFRTAAIHELMHDLIQEHFPKFKDAPLWVEEGICQQAAAEYCRLRNYADILYGIDHCTDPDYGDGYRYIKKVVGVGGWPALRRWMENVDVAALPLTAPN